MKKRVDGIDVIKGICILIVVLCHTLAFTYTKPEGLSMFLESIFLHDFFFVAGWVYALKKKTGKDIYLRDMWIKIKSLGIPYVLLSVIAIAYHFVIVCILKNPYVSEAYSGKQLIIRDIFCTASLLGVGTLWFLPILLVSTIALMFLLKIEKNKLRRSIIIIGAVSCGIASMYMQNIPPDAIPDSMVGKVISEEIIFFDRIFRGIMYTFAGYILGSIYDKSKKNKNILFVLAIVMLGAGIATYAVGIEAFIVLYSISFPILIIYVCENPYVSKILIPLRYCGEKSLEIMYIHYIIVYPIVMKFLVDALQYYCSYVSIRFISFFVVLAVTILLVWLSGYSTKVGFVFGRSKEFKRFINR